MKVISQYLGYSFRLLATLLFVYLAVIALALAHHLYGIWGYVVGILLLPVTVPAAVIYQGFVFAQWTHVIGLILMPFLWIIGSRLIHHGRTP